MADRASITKISRRTVLARGAAALPAVAAATAVAVSQSNPDARLAALARQYGQAIEELTDWIDAVKTRYGPGAYDLRPDCRPRYAALLAQEHRTAAQLAQARPDGVTGLAVKLRAAFYCDDLSKTTRDYNPDILLPALADLERLAGR